MRHLSEYRHDLHIPRHGLELHSFRFRMVNYHFNVNLIFGKFFDKRSGGAERMAKGYFTHEFLTISRTLC